MAAGLTWGRYGSGGRGDGDGQAERLELADVVADLLVLVGAAGVVVGAEVGIAGLRVVEQVPDDDQDGAGDSDLGFGPPAAAGDALVAFAEEGRGAGRAGGGLAEVAAQVTVALAFLAVAGPGAGLVGGGAEPGPGDQVGGGGEAGHVQAGLGDDRAVQLGADAGDLREPVGGGRHGGVRPGAGAGAGAAVGVHAPGGPDLCQVLLDPGGQGRDAGVAEGDLVQQHLGQLPVVVIEHAGQGLDQGVVLGFHPDRKSTRLNSSHVESSYAVFCLKKKKKKKLKTKNKKNKKIKRKKKK